jgi:hypothetical protein
MAIGSAPRPEREQRNIFVTVERIMAILLAFAPFIAFALAATFIGSAQGLVCGALVAAGLLLRDRLMKGKAVKVLEVGTFLLFGALALFVLLGDSRWSVIGVRLRVDAGLLVIALASIVIRQPFTLQYAREQTSQDVWENPLFVRANYIITLAWTFAFAVMVGADVLMLYRPDVPAYIGVVATIVAIIAAVRFTAWYPQRLRARLTG